jgi:hypothetical protein
VRDYPRNWKLRALLGLSLLLIMLSGPQGVALLVALVLPLLVPGLVLSGLWYRLKRRWRR